MGWGSRAAELENDDEKSWITQVVQHTPSTGGERETTDCLVVIYTKDSTLLGKRFVLEQQAIRVGRGAGNHIVLDGESISRRHVQFEQRGDAWFVVDLGSANGTYCNDKRISREVVLKDGDRVKVGPTLFKFLSGANVVARYHDEIYRLAIMDGLTQIYNKQYLQKALDRAIARSFRRDRALSVLMFDIDHLKRVNDVHGRLAGDFVLRELARVVQGGIRRDEVFARYGDEEFAIILPRTSLDEAVALAEALRQKVSEHLFVFQADTIRVTISFGAALLRESDCGATGFLKRADDYLYFAKNTGRNRVAASPDVESGDFAEPSAHRNHHAVIDVDALLERSLRAHPHGHLIAFEIEDEAAVVMQLGSSIYRAWFGEILSEVDHAIGKDDTLATWRERYVIAVLHGVTPEAVAATVAAITEKWTARVLTEAPSVVSRGLRAAVLTPQELAQLGSRALDVLVGRLLSRHGGTQTPEDDLPFPIAAPKAAVSTRRTAYRRVEALLDALAAALRFLVAVELALLRDSVDRELARRAAALLAGVPLGVQPLAMSVWSSLLWGLADLIAEGPTDPVHAALASLRKAGPLHVSLSAPLQRAVALSEELARGTVVSDDAYGGDEDWLHDLLDGLLAGLRLIMHMRLVSVAEIESVDDEGSGHSYALYLHRGPVEHFPIIHESMTASLLKSWCYLLSEDGSRRPLLLSPMVFSGTCATCGRVEAYLAEGLTFGPPGSSVYARSVTTNHGGAAELPKNTRTRELHHLVESAPGSPPPDGPCGLVQIPSIADASDFDQEVTEKVRGGSSPTSRLHRITSLLRADQLREIESAAVKVGLTGERTALLSFLSIGIASSLPVAPSPLGQLVSDLAFLNCIVVAADGSIPLKQWLSGACTLRQAYTEVAIFERAMKHIDGAKAPEPPAKEEGER